MWCTENKSKSLWNLNSSNPPPSKTTLLLVGSSLYFTLYKYEGNIRRNCANIEFSLVVTVFSGPNCMNQSIVRLIPFRKVIMWHRQTNIDSPWLHFSNQCLLFILVVIHDFLQPCFQIRQTCMPYKLFIPNYKMTRGSSGWLLAGVPLPHALARTPPVCAGVQVELTNR